MRRILLVSLLAGVMIATVTPAKACSCGLGDPRDAIKNADAAIVGTFLFRREVNPRPENGLISSGRPMDFTFRVDEEIKGDFGRRVTVRSAADGVSCGLGVRKGRQTGLLLYFQGANWRSSLCSQMRPIDLREAAEPLPEPDGEGDAALLVAGSMGEAGTLALDDDGRTLGYAIGDHDVFYVDTCPGSDLFVEVWHDYGEKPHLVVRDVSSLDVVRDTELFFLGARWSGQGAAEVSCRDPGAEEVILLSVDDDRRRTTSYIWRIRPDAVEIVDEGTARLGRFIDDRLYMREGKGGRLITYFDLVSDERVHVADAPQVGTLWLDPSLTRVASFFGNDTARLKLLDFSTDPPTLQTKEVGKYKSGDILWLDDETFAVLPGGYDNARIEIYNDELELLSKLEGEWYTHANVYDNGVVWGLGWGEIYRVELPDGEPEVVRELESPVWYDIELVEGD